ncbi:hypothetical protein PV327_004166 [Microctonus hyperodae]|uniref:Uncharacterized protein n=1 Tax=Microctonus hyperodae TaxID=165561 RepID=A0AA39KMA6_MICHY|nr:hypothetical protein PV327_004166 [Microctonus hyperodae]
MGVSSNGQSLRLECGLELAVTFLSFLSIFHDKFKFVYAIIIMLKLYFDGKEKIVVTILNANFGKEIQKELNSNFFKQNYFFVLTEIFVMRIGMKFRSETIDTNFEWIFIQNF